MRMILVAALAIVPMLAKDNDGIKRLNEAAVVLNEVMAAPDKGIPEDLLARAHCIVIVPGVKTAAFVVGAKYGKATCRAGIEAESAGRRRARFASKGAALASRSAPRRRT